MTYFPTPTREAFLSWVAHGCPDVAIVEQDFAAVEVAADDLLRWMLDCSDRLPPDACGPLAAQLGFQGRLAGASYGLAATALLIRRGIGAQAAVQFLQLVLGPGEPMPASMSGTGARSSSSWMRAFRRDKTLDGALS